MELSRRGFLGGILALGLAPAIVRVGSLMPIKVLNVGIYTSDDHGVPIYFGLMDVTRKAFVPRCFVDMYFASPVLKMFKV